MSIDEFIDIVAPKLKMPVVKTSETMDGKTLKLTGYTEVKGKPIEDHKLYKIPVPVQIYVDHRRKLTLAWLRGGKPAVRRHILKYLSDEDTAKVMSVLP